MGFLHHSNNKFVRFLSCSALKMQLEDKWKHVTDQMKVDLTTRLVACLLDEQLLLSMDHQVFNMISLCLAKLVKLSWFEEVQDSPELAAVIPKLAHLSKTTRNSTIKVLAIKVLNQIVVEMSFKAKKITPLVNRRISLNFRETHLKAIFEDCLKHLEQAVAFYQSAWNPHDQESNQQVIG